MCVCVCGFIGVDIPDIVPRVCAGGCGCVCVSEPIDAPFPFMYRSLAISFLVLIFCVDRCGVLGGVR